MMKMRRAADRGFADHGWLFARHTFSFADYQDPANMGYRTLRVINEDTVQPGKGFGTHGHRDMEILTYVVDGAIEHKDSMGNGDVLKAGEVQRMSAGTGVTHSEFNASDAELLHLFQIWIYPERDGIEPGYEQREFSAGEKRGALRVIASPDQRDGALKIHQDAEVYASILGDGESVTHALESGRGAWIQNVRGTMTVNGETLGPSDAVAVEDVAEITVAAVGGEAEFLLFDLA